MIDMNELTNVEKTHGLITGVFEYSPTLKSWLPYVKIKKPILHHKLRKKDWSLYARCQFEDCTECIKCKLPAKPIIVTDGDGNPLEVE
jgi:hypothetical protein